MRWILYAKAGDEAVLTLQEMVMPCSVTLVVDTARGAEGFVARTVIVLKVVN